MFFFAFFPFFVSKWLCNDIASKPLFQASLRILSGRSAKLHHCGFWCENVVTVCPQVLTCFLMAYQLAIRHLLSKNCSSLVRSWPGLLVSNQTWQQFGQTTWLALGRHSSWFVRQIPLVPEMRKRWDADNNVLQTTSGRRGMAKADLGWWNLWWILRWRFWACKERGSGGENNSVRFSPPTTMVQRDPSKSPWISPFQNMFLTEIPHQFCLRAFVFANFAGNIFAANFVGTLFRRRQFFRQSLFSPSPFFCRQQFSPHWPFMLPSKTPTRPCCLLFPEAKQSWPKLLVGALSLLVKIEILFLLRDYHNRNCMSTTHSNFQILQLKCFAGVSLCRLV